ncbi:MAG: nitroreductase family protein [Acidimicrobiia bacterium]
MPYESVPYRPLVVPDDQQHAVADAVFAEMDSRRTVREFSDKPVSRHLIETAIRCASTAPSGAHMQPWTFVLVGDTEVKRQIRIAAEAEERQNYEGGRIPPHWREDLAPLGTDADKMFLETAPWLVVVFEQRYGTKPDGDKQHHYYVKESVGIACGMFIDALHRMGLSTLTHTPSPMAFLKKLLDRPESERPFILFPVGYAAEGTEVPDLARKPLDQVMVEVNETPGTSLDSSDEQPTR